MYTTLRPKIILRGLMIMNDWRCPHCNRMPNWVDGPLAYCSNCNKKFNVETGKATSMDKIDANTCKDVKISVQ